MRKLSIYHIQQFVILVCIIITPGFVFSQYSDVKSYTVTNGKIFVITQKDRRYSFDSARYTVFIPDNIDVIKGVFIHQHGCTMEGRGISTANDIQYQAFAKKWRLAVVGPDIYSAQGNCHDWRNPESGSGWALIKTLEEIGKFSGHRELANAPWLIWGHSGGGYWALSMLRNYSRRIMCIFAYSPAFELGDYPTAALKVPVLMRHAGPVGDACCWQTSLTEFHKLRSAGGYTSIVYTPYQSHNYSFVRYMAIPFYESVLSQRLPTNNSIEYQAMRDMDTSKSWMGDTLSYNIYKYSAYVGNKMNAAWFPDSITAAKWREYAITGTVVDHTSPPAPYDIHLNRRHNVTVELTWKADADIESGISHFNIYKDDKLIGRFPSYGEYQQFDTNGDDAYPLTIPEMRTDLTLLWNDTGNIAISTVNHFGLESTKTVVH